MSRYFYDYSVGQKIECDAYGVICIDDQAAVAYAWDLLPKMMAETKAIMPWQHFEMIVRRDDGVYVGRVSIDATVETQNPATAMMLAHDRRKAITKIF